MTSHHNDTPSPRSQHPLESSQNGPEIPDSQEKSPAEPVRRPSFEKLDPAEVKQALEIAELLKKKKTAAQKVKSETEKKAKKPSAPPPPPAEYIPRPPPVPFSDNSNPDAIALRATSSLLQMQKARATENIQRLEQLRELNRKDPLQFLQKFKAGDLKPVQGSEGILGPTIAPDVEQLLQILNLEASEGEAKDEKVEEKAEEKEKEKTATPTLQNGEAEEYPRFPVRQTVIRTPAISWAKYGIVGDTLDKMHEEQRTNPSLGEPERLATRDSQPAIPIAEQHQYTEDKAPKFVIAAPYDPLKDLKDRVKKPY